MPHTALAERLAALVGEKRFGASTAWLCKRLDAHAADLGDALETAKSRGALLGFAGHWMNAEQELAAWTLFSDRLEGLHQKKPRAFEHSAKEIATAVGLPLEGKSLHRWIAHRQVLGSLRATGDMVAIAGFCPALSPKQTEFLARVCAALDKLAVVGPSIADLTREVHAPPQAVAEILRIGCAVDQVVEIAPGLHLTQSKMEDWVGIVRKASTQGDLATAEVRDALGTSRRVAVALLEWLDQHGETERVGDLRRLK